MHVAVMWKASERSRLESTTKSLAASLVVMPSETIAIGVLRLMFPEMREKPQVVSFVIVLLELVAQYPSSDLSSAGPNREITGNHYRYYGTILGTSWGITKNTIEHHQIHYGTFEETLWDTIMNTM